MRQQIDAGGGGRSKSTRGTVGSQKRPTDASPRPRTHDSEPPPAEADQLQTVEWRDDTTRSIRRRHAAETDDLAPLVEPDVENAPACAAHADDRADAKIAGKNLHRSIAVACAESSGADGRRSAESAGCLRPRGDDVQCRAIGVPAGDQTRVRLRPGVRP